MDPSLKVSDFLNPASMLTPGIAGSITMMIANALSAVFGLEPEQIGPMGLALSFLLGSLLISGVSLWRKIVYYVVNSMIIFCMAFGTASLASEAATNEHGVQDAAFSLIGSAYAGEATSQDVNAKSPTLTQAEVSALLQALKDATTGKDPNDPAVIAARAEIAKALQELQSPAPVEKTAKRAFFQQWKF